MAEPSEAELQEWRDCFSMCDKNKDGTISSSELITVLRGIGRNPTNAEADQIMKSIDTSGNGKIEFQEFKMAMIRRGPRTREDEYKDIRACFDVIDKDKNGVISAEELIHFMTNYGERMTTEEAKAMIQDADTNGDGLINLNEFAKKMTGCHPHN